MSRLSDQELAAQGEKLGDQLVEVIQREHDAATSDNTTVVLYALADLAGFVLAGCERDALDTFLQQVALRRMEHEIAAKMAPGEEAEAAAAIEAGIAQIVGALQ